VVNVAVDGLECEQQKDLQRHQRESGRSHATCRGRTGASLTREHKRQKNRYKQRENKDRIDDSGEGNVRRGAEPAGVAQLELRAP